MPQGGTLSLATRRVSLPADKAQESNAGAYVLVSVKDTGEGMSDEVREKVFDPFFTTKPIGQGTGLGLSMVYGFIRQSGGRVALESELGKGTIVSLALPVGEAAERPVKAERVAATGTGEKVLVVEDDAQVRLLVMEVLKELGYAALEASDANGALAILDGGERIDLIISDVGLPGLNGRQLAERARQKRNGVKVLFITGYAEHAAVRSEFLEAGMDMLAKPFALDDLAAKIREMIAS